MRSPSSIGAFLFRWRSYLPLLLIGVAIAGISQSGWIKAEFGAVAELSWDVCAGLVAFSGLAIRIATVGFAPARTSGRNTRTQVADRLNTTGLYSLTRNPLYFGNTVTVVGLALSTQAWWAGLIALAACIAFYIPVIHTEQAFLREKFGAAYETWYAQTPMLFPGFGNWRPPDMPFSLRSVLRREYNGFYLIVVVLFVIEAATDVVGEGRPLSAFVDNDMSWLYFFGVGTVIWAVLRSLKKYTNLLRVDGR